MRAMESAVFELAKNRRVKLLNYKGDAATWGKLLGNIEKKIATYKTQSIKDKYAKALPLLSAFNRAYRIDTAHGDNDIRPRGMFTKGDAEECWNASKSAMQYIARLISE